MPRSVILGAVVVQIVCAGFFLATIVNTVLGLRPISWSLYEAIEIGAALGLVLGSGLGLIALRNSVARTRRAEAKLRAASVAFVDLLQDRFAQWGLTPAERDVALFAIKGMSTAEIAGLRTTSEGTVKAQTAAIYRKAGVTGRSQLLSLFIEDLMSDGPMSDAAAPDAAPALARP